MAWPLSLAFIIQLFLGLFFPLWLGANAVSLPWTLNLFQKMSWPQVRKCLPWAQVSAHLTHVFCCWSDLHAVWEGWGLGSKGGTRLTPWTVLEHVIPHASCCGTPQCTVPLACLFILPGQHRVGLRAYLPPSRLSIDLLLEVIRERGYFLGVGRFVGLGLFMQVLEGRFLSSLEHGVAAGTNQPLVWGRVGDDLSHRPFRWDVLLLCKHVRNQSCVGVFPVPYQEHFPPYLPALHASCCFAFYPPASR